MGIWYKKDSIGNRMVVWVANRDKPLYYQSSAELRLLQDGNLVLLNQASQIWSTNSTSNGTLEAVLGDDGNLVLRDVLNPSLVIWQSFDYPTDTWLPGMKLGFNKRTNKTQVLTSWRNVQDPAPGLYSLELDPSGIAQFTIVWNRSINFWTSGRWNGQFFHSKLEMQEILSIYNFSFTDNLSESYFTYTSHSNQPISNFVLGSEGQVKVFRWSKAMSEWNLFASKPKQLSEVYGVCGAFGIFKNEMMVCDCLPGFEKPYSGINTSKVTEVRIAQVRSAEECELACSSNCSCNAYSYEGNECLLFDGDLLNLVQQSDDGDLLNFKYPLYVSPKGLKLMYYVVAPIFFLGFSTLGVIVCIFLHRKKGVIIDFWKTILKQLKGLVIDLLKKTLEKLKESPNANMFRNGEDKGQTPELQLFDFAVLAIATNNFCLRNKLGQGGFGPVYKGKLRSGQEIAIKRLSKSSGQGIEEFKNEVLLISKLQHKNLVRLLGCCTEEEEYMLVYEYMPNKSLDAFLFGSPS